MGTQWCGGVIVNYVVETYALGDSHVYSDTVLLLVLTSRLFHIEASIIRCQYTSEQTNVFDQYSGCVIFGKSLLWCTASVYFNGDVVCGTLYIVIAVMESSWLFAVNFEA